MSNRIKGIKPIRKTLADGTVVTYLYHRATGRRLPDDPTSTAFKIAMEQNDRDAAAARAPASPEVPTIASLIRRYQASGEWTRLASSTRAVEQFHINAIEAEFGDMELAIVERRGSRAMFLDWRDDLARKTPRSADAKLVRLARILKFAYDRELIDRHPLASFKRVYSVDRSEMIWLPAHFAALNAVATPAIQLIAFVALHTGQRRGDLMALRWRQYDGQGLTIVQGKTGARVYVPCTKALKATLDGLRAATLVEVCDDVDMTTLHVLRSSGGFPWTPNSFRLAWQRASKAARITGGLHFHDIRGTAVTMLAEAGATVPEIASITGHTLATATRILATYLSATRPLAESAIMKLDALPTAKLVQALSETALGNRQPLETEAAIGNHQERGRENLASKIDELVARPKRFELLTPRFVV